MTSMLRDTEKLVVETIRMRLTTEQALEYLKYNGFHVSRATYFRHKRKLEEKKFERLHHIAKLGFEDQHLERIDLLELITKLMFQEYSKETQPMKRVEILSRIALIQPYLSTYYEATKYVIDERSYKREMIRHQENSQFHQKSGLIDIGRNEITNNYEKQVNITETLVAEREETFNEVKERMRRMKEQAVF